MIARWLVSVALILGILTAVSWGTESLVFGQEAVEDTEVDEVRDVDSYTDIELWEMISALFIPLLVQAIKNRGWDDETSRLALVAIAAVVAVIGAHLRGELTADFTLPAAMKLVIMSYASYEAILKMKGVAGVTAWFGSLGKNAPTTGSQRSGYQGIIPDTPPPGG